MVKCNRCRRNIAEIPFRCKFCNEYHCSSHRLPEDHKCKGLDRTRKHNQERWSNVLIGAKTHQSKTHHKRDRIKHSAEPLEQVEDFAETTTKYLKKRYHKLKHQLMRREHRRYSHWRRFREVLLFTIISLVSLKIFYSNVDKLNEVEFWIFNFGALLVLGSIFFSIKYGYRFIKELFQLLRRQRNWVKYLGIILILILLWQGYTDKENVFNPILDFNEKINYNKLIPLNIDLGTALNSTDNFLDNVDNVLSFDPDWTENELEMRVHELINVERQINGLPPLAWDSKINSIAKAHSQDMVDRNFYSHDNPDGDGPSERGKKAGYHCSKDLGGGWYSDGLAENIAITPIHSNVIGCGSTYSLESMAECIVNGWMTSPGHRENILTSQFDKEGLGISVSEGNDVYSTQNFC